MNPADSSHGKRTKRTSALSAFTVIELIVAVGVIAILASLLLPAVCPTQAAARSAKCKANLHQLGLALRMYVDDFAIYPLLSSPIDPTRSTGPWKEWPHDLAPYVQVALDQALSDRSFRCTERQRAQPGRRSLTNTKSGPAYNDYGYNGAGCKADADPDGLRLGTAR